MKSLRCIPYVFVLICMVFAATTASAENRSDSMSVGISGTIQTAQTDIMLPIWISRNIVIAPTIGLSYIQDAGTDLELAFVTRMFLTRKTVTPFIGARAGTIIYSPSTGTSLHDYLVGLCAGGEYFFGEKLSVGIEAQVNLGIDDSQSTRFGTLGGKALSTGTMVYATIYF